MPQPREGCAAYRAVGAFARVLDALDRLKDESPGRTQGRQLAELTRALRDALGGGAAGPSSG